MSRPLRGLGRLWGGVPLQEAVPLGRGVAWAPVLRRLPGAQRGWCDSKALPELFVSVWATPLLPRTVQRFKSKRRGAVWGRAEKRSRATRTPNRYHESSTQGWAAPRVAGLPAVVGATPDAASPRPSWARGGARRLGSGARLRAPEPPSPEAALRNRRGEPRAPGPGKPASLGPSRRAFQPATREQADPTSFHLGCWGAEGGGSPARDLGTGTQEAPEDEGAPGERGAQGRRGAHPPAGGLGARGGQPGSGVPRRSSPPTRRARAAGPRASLPGSGAQSPQPLSARAALRLGSGSAGSELGVPSSAPEHRPGPAPGRRGAPGGGGGGGVWRLRTPAPGSSAPPGLRPLPTSAPRRI